MTDFFENWIKAVCLPRKISKFCKLKESEFLSCFLKLKDDRIRFPIVAIIYVRDPFPAVFT